MLASFLLMTLKKIYKKYVENRIHPILRYSAQPIHLHYPCKLYVYLSHQNRKMKSLLVDVLFSCLNSRLKVMVR